MEDPHLLSHREAQWETSVLRRTRASMIVTLGVRSHDWGTWGPTGAGLQREREVRLQAPPSPPEDCHLL